MEPAEQLGNLLTQRTWTLAVAESCTGGLLASTITDVPGSSTYFLGGMIAYSNSSKIEILGVPTDTIQKFGAVSDRAAIGMAVGIINNFGCDFAIAITGIAGPGGGSAEKPVGLVFIGVQRRGRSPRIERHVFAGDRAAVREASLELALRLMLEETG